VSPAPDAPVPVTSPAPAVPESPVAASTRRPFGLWNRKSRRPVATPEQAAPAPTTSGDLFGDDMEDELEIPSFLRRQNR
ncbi:MAG: cell division protein FtsZ, partial [Litorimonas sp.]